MIDHALGEAAELIMKQFPNKNFVIAVENGNAMLSLGRGSSVSKLGLVQLLRIQEEELLKQSIELVHHNTKDIKDMD
jgi:hypothetical protein